MLLLTHLKRWGVFSTEIKPFKSYNPAYLASIIRSFIKILLRLPFQISPTGLLPAQILLLFPCYIVDDPTFVHHNQTVADLNRIFHVMGNHRQSAVRFCSSTIFSVNRGLCGLFLGSRAAVCSSKRRALASGGCHQKGERTALIRRRVSPLCWSYGSEAPGRAVPMPHGRSPFHSFLMPQPSPLDLPRRSAMARFSCISILAAVPHRILEDSADIFSAFVFWFSGYVYAIDLDFTGIDRIYACDHI